MSKLLPYPCQGQRQGQIMKVKHNYSLDKLLKVFSCSQVSQFTVFSEAE